MGVIVASGGAAGGAGGATGTRWSFWLWFWRARLRGLVRVPGVWVVELDGTGSRSMSGTGVTLRNLGVSRS